MAAQDCSSFQLQWQSDIAFSCNEQSMSMYRDRIQRPYLYIAGKESGLQIYDISNLQMPIWVSEVPTDSLGGLDVMSVYQVDSFLYLANGSHFVNGQNAGMAIIDISDPSQPTVTDHWVHNQPEGGAGVIRTVGDYAYLGAMEDGLMIFDISDKYNLQWVSSLIPDINYPEPNPDPAKYNLRGLWIENEIAYACYDAGGIRIINISDKQNPIETGRYSLPLLNGKPRAYNNLILQGSLLFVSIDYCGLEILNVADTSNITQTGWWNPWQCETSPLKWFSSPGHTNEIAYLASEQKVFLSTGKSDLYVVDVSDPSLPDSCANYGGISNNIGTWGLDVWENEVYLSYICALIPFTSNWAGVKVLTFNRSNVSLETETSPLKFRHHYDPLRAELHLASTVSSKETVSWRILQIDGSIIQEGNWRMDQPLTLSASHWPDGIYIVHIKGEGGEAVFKWWKSAS